MAASYSMDRISQREFRSNDPHEKANAQKIKEKRPVCISEHDINLFKESHDALKDKRLDGIIGDKDIKIIAVGGGFPLKNENQLLLRKYTVIFIDIDFNMILSRLTPDEKAKRPLLTNLEPDEIKKLYKKRLNIYKNTSNYVAQDINEVFRIIQSRL